MAYRGQPPSFKTDVHRAPTKKWANAKAYSYEGDDWGGYDEYGEYGTYDDPPPLPKPTGLRQPGQGLPTADAPADAPSTSIPSAMRPRADSFEANDESRNFSAGALPPSESAHNPSNEPDLRPSSLTYAQGQPTYLTQGMRSPPLDIAGTSVASSPSTQFRHSSGTQASPSIGFHDRRSGPGGFQNTASPRSSSNDLYSGPRGYSNPPASRPMYNDAPIASSAPPNDSDSSFPPRKSSLTTGRPSDIPVAISLPPRDDSLPQAQAIETATIPPGSAESGAPKPFPFIRPADIYKRIQEEKEKERRSMDSNRSSLESMSRSGRDDRPFSGTSQARESSGSPARMRPSLQPVPERKSEYGLEGLAAQNPELAKDLGVEASSTDASQASSTDVQGIGTVSDSRALPAEAQVASSSLQNTSTDAQAPRVSQDSSIESQSLPRDSQDSASSAQSQQSVLPSLPQLSRISGFGTDFWGLSSSAQPPVPDSLGPPADTEPSRSVQVTETPAVSNDPSLQHQPSLGFRSAVEHAFEPQTPLSVQGSQRSAYGSELSGSNDTAGISPIMSRMPSAATAMRNAHDRSEMVATPTVIAEEPPPELNSTDSRPDSADTLRGPAAGTSSAQPRTLSGESGTGLVSSGYRRDMTPPGSAAVPARALAVSTEQAYPEGSAAEIERTSPSSNYTQTPSNDTPIDRSHLHQSDYTTGTADGGERQSPSVENDTTLATETQSADQDSLADSQGIQNLTDSSPIERASGTTTPSKGRVKDLASRYDIIHSSRQNSFDSTTSNKSRPISPANALSLSGTAEKNYVSQGNLDGSSEAQNESPMSSTQLGGEETRPSLPGAWVSNADSARSQTPSEAQSSEDTSRVMQTPDGILEQSTERSAATEQSIGQDGRMLPPPNMPADSSLEMTPTIHDRGFDDMQPPPLLSQKGTTPTSFESQGGQISTPAPLRRGTPTPINTSMAQGSFAEPANTTNMSLESSPEDSESDRIRKDIVRSLNTSNEGQVQNTSDPTTPLSAGLDPASPNDDPTRESTALPREYDSYWASTGNFTRSPGTGASRETQTSIPTPILEVPPSPQAENVAAVGASPVSTGQRSTSPAAPPMLKKRFSWEQEDDENNDDNGGETAPNPSEGLGISQSPSLAQGGTFNNTSPITTVGPSERAISSSSPGPMQRNVGISPTEPTAAYSIPEIKFDDADDEDEGPGRNLTFMDPVPEETRQRDSVESSVADENALSQTSAESKDFPVEQSPAAARPASQIKLTPFKEITAMKQSTQRVQTYNQTREGFATMHTGLNDWLAFMIAAHPEHGKPSGPTVNTSGLAGSARTKMSPSAGKGMSPSGSQPYYQQYLDSAGGLPTLTTQGPASSPGQLDAGAKNRSSSGQMQVKGKDLLHSAGVLGGKASTGAKGLFAKGKSKFRTGSTSEKGSSSSPASAAPRGLLSTFAKKDKGGSTPPAPQATSPDYAQSGPNMGNRDAALQTAPNTSASLEPSNPPIQLVDNASGTSPLRSISEITHDSPAPTSTRTSELYGSPEDNSTRPIDPTDHVPDVYNEPKSFQPGDGDHPMTGNAESLRESREIPPVQARAASETAYLAPSSANANKPLPPKPQELGRGSYESLQTGPGGDVTQTSADGATTPASDVGVFGARGMALWQDTPPEAFEHALPPSLLHEQEPGLKVENARASETSAATDALNSTRSSATLQPPQDTSENHQREQDAPIFTASPSGKEEDSSTDAAVVTLANFSGQAPYQMPEEFLNGTPPASIDVPTEMKDPKANALEIEKPEVLAQAISRGSKEIAISPTEVHPALRNDTESEASLSEQFSDQAPSQAPEQAQERGGIYGGLPPAVDLDKLPPSVRKQYSQKEDQPPTPRQIESIELGSALTSNQEKYFSNASTTPRQQYQEHFTPVHGVSQAVSNGKAQNIDEPATYSRDNEAEYRVPAVGPPLEGVLPSAGITPRKESLQQEKAPVLHPSDSTTSEASRSRRTSSSWNVFKRVRSGDKEYPAAPSAVTPVPSSTLSTVDNRRGQNVGNMYPPSGPISQVEVARDSSAMPKASARTYTEASRNVGASSGSGYNSPMQRSGNVTPTESQSHKLKKPQRHSNILKGTPAAVSHTRDADTNKRRASWFGGFLGSPKGAESESAKSRSRLSKVQSVRSQPSQPAQPTELFAPTRLPDRLPDRRTSGIREATPSASQAYHAQYPGPSLPSFEPIAEQPPTTSDATGAEGDEQGQMSQGFSNRASHVQYLANQGLFPPRAPTNRGQTPPTTNLPAQRVGPQWAYQTETSMTPPTFDQQRSREAYYSQQYSQSNRPSQLQPSSTNSQLRAQEDSWYATLPAPPTSEYHDGGYAAARSTRFSSPEAQLPSGSSSGPPLPYVPFLSQQSASSWSRSEPSATSQPLDWQPASTSPVIQGAWAPSRYESRDYTPPPSTQMPLAFSSSADDARKAGVGTTGIEVTSEAETGGFQDPRLASQTRER